MGREGALSEDLGKLSEAIAKWRGEGGGRGTKIPDELWNEAVRVARVEGVWRTARAMRLEYAALKQRLARAGGEVTTAASPARRRRRAGLARPTRQSGRKPPSSRRRKARRQSSEFVELSTAQLVGAPPTGTIVEVEDKAGMRMTVRLAKDAPVDVAQL